MPISLWTRRPRSPAAFFLEGYTLEDTESRRVNLKDRRIPPPVITLQVFQCLQAVLASAVR